MRKFAELVPNEEILQTVSAILSWSHNIHLFDKARSLNEYIWYAVQTIENGWSLKSLEYHTETHVYYLASVAVLARAVGAGLSVISALNLIDIWQKDCPGG